MGFLTTLDRAACRALIWLFGQRCRECSKVAQYKLGIYWYCESHWIVAKDK